MVIHIKYGYINNYVVTIYIYSNYIIIYIYMYINHKFIYKFTTYYLGKL